MFTASARYYAYAGYFYFEMARFAAPGRSKAHAC